MLRMEIACVLILIFIAAIYFNAEREKTAIHKTFSTILIVLIIHMVLDGVTVYTVNHLDTIPKWINDTLHRFFVATMLGTVYLYYRYICELIAEEMEREEHSRLQLVIKYFFRVYFWVAELLIFVTPVSYTVTDKGNYEAGIGAGIMFVSIPLFLFHMVCNMIRHWKYVHPKKRSVIAYAMTIEIVVTGLTAIDMSLLLAGMGLTMIALSFYLVLENPDVRLLQQAREEKRKADETNASKSAFLSVVSHEIRTPMNAIVGMTDLLLSGELTATQEKYLKNIKTSGDALVMIVNDLLDQSKIEAGKMEIVEDVYEWAPLLENVRMIVENRIDTKPIHVIMKVDERLPERIVGDSLRIRQIIINLMNNAVKFTEEGYVELSIQIEAEDEGGFRLRYAVKDSGQGIRQEDLEHLFQAFSQVDQKKNHSKEGTGLGLSISRDFVHLMGGELSVASEYGSGSEFFFTLYQRKADENAKSLDEEVRELRDKEFKAVGARVLLVDDTPINIKIVKKMLEEHGIAVDSAGSGAKAHELVKENRYDIIFMDYMMPYMDGVEATQKIRSFAQEETDIAKSDYYKNVPVVALTGDCFDETKELFRKAGMDDFLEKPIQKVGLNRVLLKWLPKECIKIQEQE